MQKLIKNFLGGASTVLILMPPQGRIRIAESILRKSDSEALHGDWRAVGDELRWALEEARTLIADGKTQT